MKDYTVAAVNPEPRDWSGSFGPMRTYQVRFEELGVEPVELNKKPTSPPPQVGEVLYGKIDQTEYGKKFKAVKRQDVPFAGSQTAPKSQPKDEAAIKAMWAIGQAVAYYKSGDLPNIESAAKDFYAMVDRVKGSTVAAGAAWDLPAGAKPIPNEPTDLSEIAF